MEGSNITIAIAFAAGLLSFLSPCVLPLVPGYLSLISGVSVEHLKGGGGSRARARKAVILNSLAFNAGLSIIFIALGAAAGWVGSAIISNPWVRIIGGLVIIAFGLQLIGLLKIGALYRDTRKFSDEKPRGPLGALTLGMAFAAGWTPCIGPILGGIIGLAATSGQWQSGLVLSAFYAAGLAVPFLVTGVLLNQFLGFYSRFRRHLHKVEVISGVLLIVIGVMVMSNSVTWLASVASGVIPNAEGWLQSKVESSQTAQAPAAPAAATGQSAQPAAASKANFEPAPDVELKTLDGQPLRLSDLRGQVVLLNFWATWCVPCRAEIPELNAMHNELGARGFTVLGVTTHDTAALVREYQKDVRQDYRVVTGDQSVASKYAAVGLPTTFIIDREGRIRQRIVGERKRPAFDAVVLPLLEEAAATASN
ncbi:MAG TPA: cytochrome c biogenesis protein CcdA [Pyrinomonadaceae bacterium]